MPAARRAQASAFSASTPSASSASATRDGGSGSKRTGWQREATVSITRLSRSVSRIRCTNAAGSSSVFSSRLATVSFIVSTRSSTKTRRLDSNGVREAAATTGPSTSAARIWAAPVGLTQVRSGWLPLPTRWRTRSGSASPSASSSAAKARATVRLPTPAGPWKRYACEGPAASAAASATRAWGWSSVPASIGGEATTAPGGL